MWHCGVDIAYTRLSAQLVAHEAGECILCCEGCMAMRSFHMTCYHRHHHHRVACPVMDVCRYYECAPFCL